MTEQFVWKYHPRIELKQWLERNFDYFGGRGRNLEQITTNAAAILNAVSQVMNFTMQHSGDGIKEYYKEDLPTIYLAYVKKDMQRFADAVDDLKGGIEWE